MTAAPLINWPAGSFSYQKDRNVQNLSFFTSAAGSPNAELPLGMCWYNAHKAFFSAGLCSLQLLKNLR